MIDVNLGRGHSLTLEFKPSYQNMIEWLKQKELLKRAVVTADDVPHVLVAKRETVNPDDIEKIKKEIEKSSHTLDVTNKGQLEKLLNNASPDPTHEYQAVFYYQFGGYYEVMSFDEKHAPDFIKDHFK